MLGKGIGLICSPVWARLSGNIDIRGCGGPREIEKPKNQKTFKKRKVGKLKNQKSQNKRKSEKTEHRTTGKPKNWKTGKTENQTLGLSFTKSWGSALWFLASPSEKAETEKPENQKTDKPKTWVKFHRELGKRTLVSCLSPKECGSTLPSLDKGKLGAN
jgi:hypothetical protein